MEVSAVQITFDVSPCNHFSVEREGELLKCVDCGSMFPRAGNQDNWATGTRPVNVKVKFNSK